MKKILKVATKVFKWELSKGLKLILIEGPHRKETMLCALCSAVWRGGCNVVRGLINNPLEQKFLTFGSWRPIFYYYSNITWVLATHLLNQGSQTGISRAACCPSTCSMRPATKIKIRKCPKMTRFLDYFRKMRSLNTFFGLYAARETNFYKNVALEDIWVWNPCAKQCSRRLFSS